MFTHHTDTNTRKPMTYGERRNDGVNHNTPPQNEDDDEDDEREEEDIEFLRSIPTETSTEREKDTRTRR